MKKIIEIRRSTKSRSGFRSYILKLPEGYSRFLRCATFTLDKQSYKFTTIPIDNQPQEYYIIPRRNEEAIFMSRIYRKSQMPSQLTFYGLKGYKVLDFIQFLKEAYVVVDDKGKYIYGASVSENGMTVNISFEKEIKKFKKLLENYGTLRNGIILSNWNLSIRMLLSSGFEDENGKAIQARYGNTKGFKDKFEKLLQFGYLFKKSIYYDPYMIMNFEKAKTIQFINDFLKMNPVKEDEIQKMILELSPNIEISKSNIDSLKNTIEYTTKGEKPYYQFLMQFFGIDYLL
jgi:hypothetical protein